MQLILQKNVTNFHLFTTKMCKIFANVKKNCIFVKNFNQLWNVIQLYAERKTKN